MEAASAAHMVVPTAAEAEAQGFTLADYEVPVEVWPENWPSWHLWTEIRGQLRVGMGGAYALDYGPLFTRMERMRLSDEDWNDMFGDIRVIEAAALEAMKKD